MLSTRLQPAITKGGKYRVPGDFSRGCQLVLNPKFPNPSKKYISHKYLFHYIHSQLHPFIMINKKGLCKNIMIVFAKIIYIYIFIRATAKLNMEPEKRCLEPSPESLFPLVDKISGEPC